MRNDALHKGWHGPSGWTNPSLKPRQTAPNRDLRERASLDPARQPKAGWSIDALEFRSLIRTPARHHFAGG